MPVVFTTAKLFVADVDLSTGEIETGKLEMGEGNIKSVPWLLYQYPQSPALKYKLLTGKEKVSNTLSFSQFQYIRTVPIVTASGIEAFLRWASAIEIRNW